MDDLAAASLDYLRLTPAISDERLADPIDLLRVAGTHCGRFASCMPATISPLHDESPSTAAGQRSQGGALLLVVLYDLRLSDPRGVRVESGFPQGAPLAQQVPALVEGDAELSQALPVGFAGVTRRLTLPQAMLFGHQLLDVFVDLRIVHHAS
jgi:hypothetical protein